MEINGEYPNELFNCQKCNFVKQNSLLLDCFHNICSDCEQENNEINCRSCPHNPQKPQEGVKHPLNELLHKCLDNNDPIDPERKKCSICGQQGKTKYCTVCKTFWCELGIQDVHNKMIIRGDMHHMKENVAKFDLEPLPVGNGDEDDETEFNKILENLGEMKNQGEENQNMLNRKRNEIDEWVRDQENEIGRIFEEISEQISLRKRQILEELIHKSNKMQEKLEENMRQNENKLLTIQRAYLLITKMKQHKLISDPMQRFLNDRQIIEKNHTSLMDGIIYNMDLKELKNILIQFENLSLPCNLQHVDIDRSSLILKSQGTVHKSFNIGFHLIDCSGKSIKEDACDGTVYALITNKAHPSHPKPVPYGESFFPKCAGEYFGQLYVRELQTKKYYFHIKNSQTIESVSPVIKSLLEPGLVRAIAVTDNSLYCVVKEPREIRRYCILKPAGNQDLISSGVISLNGDIVSFDTNIGAGRLGSPCGICYIDAYLYVTDTGYNCVHVFTNNSEFVESFGSSGRGLGQFQRPMGIDFDNFRKELLIADTFNSRIQICELDLKTFAEFGSNENFKVKDPVDVKACSNGNAVVTTLGGQILLYDNFRGFKTLIMSDIITPRHCYIDLYDNIYVTSHLGHSIYKISQKEGEEGEFQKVKLKTDSEFRCPTGITMSRDGKLYVISRELNQKSSKSYLTIW